MTAWGIVGIVIACIALIIFIILMLPIDLLINISDKEDFSFKVRVLWFVFGGKDKKKSKVSETVEKAVGVKEVKKAKNNKEKMAISEIVSLISAALERIVWVLRHCRAVKCNIKYISAGENAAIDYGTACAVIYPLVAYMQSRMKLRKKKLTLCIGCDYDAASATYDLGVVVRVRVLYLVIALVSILIKYLTKA